MEGIICEFRHRPLRSIRRTAFRKRLPSPTPLRPFERGGGEDGGFQAGRTHPTNQMNPDTLQTIQSMLLSSSCLLLSLIIARLLMGYTKYAINMSVVIFLCVVGIVYLSYNKEYYTKKYEAELVNKILFNRVKDTLKVQLPK